MTENENFEEWSRNAGLGPEDLLQGLRCYISKKTDFLPEGDLQQTLVENGSSEKEVILWCETLAEDSALLEAATIEVLSSNWKDPIERPVIKDCLSKGKAKLPVIEVAILAIVAMYGMYLVTTGGKLSEDFKKRTTANGQEAIDRKTKYSRPSEALIQIVNLFRLRK
jgi:hypothetical protein